MSSTCNDFIALTGRSIGFPINVHKTSSNPLIHRIPYVGVRSLVKAASNPFAVALLQHNGQLLTWGKWPYCGTAQSVDVPSPLKFPNFDMVCDISMGDTHAVCCDTKGVLYSWGTGTSSLGHGVGTVRIDIPSPLIRVSGIRFCKVSCSANETFALADGCLYAWGNNAALLNTSPDKTAMPLPVQGLPNDIVEVYTSRTHVAVISNEDGVWMWGANSYSQCSPTSLEDTPIQATPRRVQIAPSEVKISKLALGEGFSLALTAGKDIYSWGRNDSGQLGQGHVQSPCTAVVIAGLSALRVVDIFAGFGQGGCMVSVPDRAILAWGVNKRSVLGFSDDNKYCSLPRKVCWNFSECTAISLLAFPQKEGHQELSTPTVWVCRSKQQLNEALSENKCTEDIRASFDVPELSDITVLVQGKVLHLSKVPDDMLSSSWEGGCISPTCLSVCLLCFVRVQYILRVRSEYFRHMFTADVAESRSGSIEITDFSYLTATSFFLFLYVGKVSQEVGSIWRVPSMYKPHCDALCSRKPRWNCSQWRRSIKSWTWQNMLRLALFEI